MSWSVTMIGLPEKLAEALDAHATILTDQSRVEFDAVLPHLKALVLENFNRFAGSDTPLVRLEASGHGTVSDGEQKHRTVSVKLEGFHAKLLL